VSDGRKKKYIEMFGSFTEPFNYIPGNLSCAAYVVVVVVVYISWTQVVDLYVQSIM